MAKKWFGKKKQSKKVNAVKDLKAIIDFLKDVSSDAQLLIPKLEELYELEKERKVATSKIVITNIQAQMDILDDLLKRYEFFQTDAEINGIRIRNIAQDVLKKAKKAGLNDLVKEKKNNTFWNKNW